jgi:hypothetical protein
MRSLYISFQKKGTIGARDDHSKWGGRVIPRGLPEVRFCDNYPIRLSMAPVASPELSERNSTLDRHYFFNNFLIRLSTVM